MLSRVEEFKQIYILESLPEDKIRASAKALAELSEMNARSINQNPIEWRKISGKCIKVASMNCMNLNNNYEDILCDPTLMESTLIALSETWLEEGMPRPINGFNSHLNSVGPGKGLAIYYKKDIFQPSLEVRFEKLQITKMESNEVDVITVYKSEQANLSALLEHLKSMISPAKTTIVCGDFNICYSTN